MIDTVNGAWVAVRVKTGLEKSVIALLTYKDYEVFNPTYSLVKRWSDRMRKVEQSIFPGYVFCRLTPGVASKIVTTPGVIYIVSFCGDCRIPDHEIDSIKILTQSGSKVQVYPYLNVGQPVRVVSGPLTGITGFLVSREDSNALVISVSLLQRSLAVQIDATSVEPVRSLARFEA